ncbi:MAG: biopolymer transporter ExbD [Rhodospirillaceae bacterium]|nr:biopolymer transporter ExbD [Rhodospirillaceae bacterium]
MARKRHQTTDGEAEIDMTPMLDVTFIMLIFFIVTATFVKESGLDVSSSQADQPLQQQKSDKVSIVIDINQSGAIVMEGREVDIRSVRPNVERLLAQNPEASVIIRAHPKSQSQVFVGAMDQARLAGAANVSIAEGG